MTWELVAAYGMTISGVLYAFLLYIRQRGRFNDDRANQLLEQIGFEIRAVNAYLYRSEQRIFRRESEERAKARTEEKPNEQPPK